MTVHDEQRLHLPPAVSRDRALGITADRYLLMTTLRALCLPASAKVS